MFCSKCGTKLNESAKFCGNCGTAVVAETEAKLPVEENVSPTIAEKINDEFPVRTDDNIDTNANVTPIGKAKKIKVKKPIYKKWWAWVVAVIIFFIIIGNLGNSDDKELADPPAKEASGKVEQTAEEKAAAKAQADADKKTQADAKAKADADEKAKADADKKAKANEEARNPKWNVKEMDAQKNGNISLAVNLLNILGDVSAKGEVADSGDVLKTPWNYYGKAITFTGSVTIVQDYPPGSDFPKMGVNCQVVFIANNGTVLDLFSTVASGKLKVGDKLTVVAYPIGILEVPNKLGGNSTQLAIVTNKLQ